MKKKPMLSMLQDFLWAIAARQTPTDTSLRYRMALLRLFERVQNVPGDIWELGVFKGSNTVLFADLIRRRTPRKRYLGFDTFSGYLPEDIQSAPNPAALEANQQRDRWKWSKEAVLAEVSKRGLTPFCEIEEGDIKETVPDRVQSFGGSIALLYIDCNAYLPAIRAMNACFNTMSSGAIICVNEHQIGGETKALREFSRKHQLKIEHTGQKYPHGPPMLVTVHRPT